VEYPQPSAYGRRVVSALIDGVRSRREDFSDEGGRLDYRGIIEKVLLTDHHHVGII